MSSDFDIAIIGSGFGGSLLAMIARRLGRSVVLLERGRHPRFAIGESSTPLANLLLEDLARRYELPAILPLAKWGAWQRAYPKLGCGLKRGFTFYHHVAGRRFGDLPDRSDQLLVGASPSDEVGDTHWYRADVDHFLVSEAQRQGAEFLDETRLDSIRWNGTSAALAGERKAKAVRIAARFVLDASGPRGALHQLLKLPEIPFYGLPPTQGLYTHFRGVRRSTELPEFHSCDAAPYPPDDAAVHHVFDGGWVWVLRFNNSITSAGIAATDELATRLGLHEGAPGWGRVLARFESLADLFHSAEPVRPFVYVPRLAFGSGRITGDWWALLPSAAGFVDPLLSTGFPLNLLGISRLAELIERGWDPDRLRNYAQRTSAELQATAQLVGALYAGMRDFPVFAQTSMLYFAGAIFAETARRLGRAADAGSFLLHDHPVFGPELRECCRHVIETFQGSGPSPERRSLLLERLRRTIELIDLGGLTNASRRNWHPFVPIDSAAYHSMSAASGRMVRSS